MKNNKNEFHLHLPEKRDTSCSNFSARTHPFHSNKPLTKDPKLKIKIMKCKYVIE